MTDKDIKSEREQALLRLAGILAYSLYVLYLSANDRIQNPSAVVVLGIVYVISAIALNIAVSRSIFSKTVRRYLGILLDVSMATAYMHLLASYGGPLLTIYLWVTIGNGFRYGSKYLVVSSLLSIAGFLLVCSTSNLWGDLGEFAITGLVLLVMVPIYVNILLKRITLEKERSELANQEKSRFLANISHEIRTPLNAIVGFSSMLDKVDDPKKKQEMVGHINNASESLMDLVEGVLDLSRIESGQVGLHESRVELGAMLASIEGMFSLQVGNKGITYTTRVSDDIPQYVMLDQQRVRQVLVNLVGNAVKFTSCGSIGVSAGLTETDDGDAMIRFDIVDTGPGMPRGFHEKVFDRFRQADDSARRQHGGAGLGTAIARSLVEMMGGNIGLDSSDNTGSRFWFTIPLKSGGQPERAASDNFAAIEGRTPKTDMLAPGVLVVEDSYINRCVYQNMFQLLDIEVDYAESGDKALELLSDKLYSLVILDMQMPGMSGAEVIDAYHERVADADRVPVVVITGDATADAKRECERLGVDAFLTKPVGVERMYKLLGEYMPLGAEMAVGH